MVVFRLRVRNLTVNRDLVANLLLDSSSGDRTRIHSNYSSRHWCTGNRNCRNPWAARRCRSDSNRIRSTGSRLTNLRRPSWSTANRKVNKPYLLKKRTAKNAQHASHATSKPSVNQAFFKASHHNLLEVSLLEGALG
jgi:hypothetical protein